MPAHERHTLRVITGAGADKPVGVGRHRQHLAHRIERPAQFVRPHRGQIFALEQNIRAIAIRQVFVPLQRCFGKHVTHGGLGGAGSILKTVHPVICGPGRAVMQAPTLPRAVKPDKRRSNLT